MWRSASIHKINFRVLVGLGLSAALWINTALVFAADSAADRYAQILAEAEDLARYNEQLSKLLQSQEAQVALIEKQLVDIDATGAAVVEQVQRMYEAIEKFIAADLPFTDPTQAGPDSRSERLNRIRDLMANENASVGEKYRRLIEAYQIELEYGRTMVAYKAKLDDGRDADFLRVGRVALMYRTEDGEESGYWDAQQNAWVVDNDLAKAIQEAVHVATKETAPDLVILPVPAPIEVQL